MGAIPAESGRAGPPFSSLIFPGSITTEGAPPSAILSRWESLSLVAFSRVPVKSILASDTKFAHHVKGGEWVEFSRKILRQNELRAKSRARGN
jgi:hypothetical protein